MTDKQIREAFAKIYPMDDFRLNTLDATIDTSNQQSRLKLFTEGYKSALSQEATREPVAAVIQFCGDANGVIGGLTSYGYTLPEGTKLYTESIPVPALPKQAMRVNDD